MEPKNHPIEIRKIIVHPPPFVWFQILPADKLTYSNGISAFLIGNTSSFRVHFPASYVRLPECNFPGVRNKKCRAERETSIHQGIIHREFIRANQ